MKNFHPFFLALLALAVLTVGCGDPGATHAAEAAATWKAGLEQPEPSPAPSPVARAPSPTVELEVVAVDDSPEPDRFFDGAPAGYRLVGIQIIVSSWSDEAVSVNPLYVTLVDDDGFVYDCELGALDEDQLPAEKILHGEKLRGWVGFVIPDDATPARARFAIGFSGDFAIADVP